MKQAIQIWCDGSYRQNDGIIGLGWVRMGGGLSDEGSLTVAAIAKQDPHGSDTAEYMAFARALAPLPDGAHVHVHMDCKNVAATLVAERISEKQNKHAGLLKAFGEAVSVKKRMGAVEISYTSDANEKMAKAHTLSRIASTPGKKAFTKKL